MKNSILLFIITANIYSFSCIAQRKDQMTTRTELGNKIVMSDRITDNENGKVAFYHVEERINKMLGGSITTYNVPSLNLVNTNDLGPNNSRVITPKYIKKRATAVYGENLKASVDASKSIPVLAVTKTIPKEAKEKTVDIDVVSTYERLLDKGYKTVDMLTKVADKHYFDGDLITAAKWYAQLFELNTNLDALYYFRYAKSLEAIHETTKSIEIMKLFESKNH